MINKILVFFEKKSNLEKAGQVLKSRNIPFLKTTNLSMNTSNRNKIISSLRESENTLVLSTDLLSRGFDFPELTKIINFDFPK
jgi:superfamily II DNA/RNA helicase